MMATVTLALCGAARRTPDSSTPTVTVARTGAVASRTDTGSVIAPVTRRTRLSAPTTSTVAGSDVIAPTT